MRFTAYFRTIKSEKKAQRPLQNGGMAKPELKELPNETQLKWVSPSQRAPIPLSTRHDTNGMEYVH